MRPNLRSLLVPRRFARLRFTFYEAAGLLMIAGMSLAIGLSFLHDSLAVSLGIIGASLFNGLLCYLVGIGIGRFGAKRLDAASNSLPRFTIRDMLWLTALVAVLVAWRVAHHNWQSEQSFLRHNQAEFDTIQRKLTNHESRDRHRAEYVQGLMSEPNPRWPLAAEQMQRIDEELRRNEWTYNPETDQFGLFFAPGPSTLELPDLTIWMPDVSLNEIVAYRQYKRQHWEAARVEQRKP
jgi:hypothetical protein